LANGIDQAGASRLRFEEGILKKGGLNPPPTNYRPPPPPPLKATAQGSPTPSAPPKPATGQSSA
jgi:hypothetical protein